MVTVNDLKKIELCIGTIVGVEDFPEAIKPSYKLTISFGDKGIRKSSAQITKNYSKEDLIGLQIVAVLNFPPKQIANFTSECLVLASIDEDNDIILLTTERAAKNGSSIA